MKRGEPVSEAATETFERYRPLLFSIAYRMLGSVMEAEDVVQEAFLRWQEASGREIRLPKSYLSKIVARLSIDRLRSAKARREEYLGPWLPEPIVTGEGSDLAGCPGQDALDGVYGAPGEPHARRAGGVPVAGGLRLRPRGDSPARRQERGQLPPDLAPRAPVRGGAPASRARPSRRSVSWTAFSKRA